MGGICRESSGTDPTPPPPPAAAAAAAAALPGEITPVAAVWGSAAAASKGEGVEEAVCMPGLTWMPTAAAFKDTHIRGVD